MNLGKKFFKEKNPVLMDLISEFSKSLANVCEHINSANVSYHAYHIKRISKI